MCYWKFKLWLTCFSSSSQKDLYDETFRPLVESVLQGYNGTIFAYGQTGTGKTYTMEGVAKDPEKQGLIPRSFEHIFSHIAQSRDRQYLVRASYLEIYKEQIRLVNFTNYVWTFLLVCTHSCFFFVIYHAEIWFLRILKNDLNWKSTLILGCL